MTSGVGATMYYSTRNPQNNWQPYQNGDEFRLDPHEPTAEGYKFLGWYDKDRPAITSNAGHYFPATSGILRPAGDQSDLCFMFNGNGGGRYTVEAIWAGINGSSKRLPYDGGDHYLTAEAVLEKGTLFDTERYRQQIERILSEGGYNLGNVEYQLVAVDGTPVENQPWTSSFSRRLPGLYTVMAKVEGTFLGSPFTLTKEPTLEIYPAKVIIIKHWIDEDDITGNRPDDLDVSLNRGAVAGVSMHLDQTGYEAAGYHEEDGIDPASVEPSWFVVDANAWSETYEMVLVRPEDFDEEDQDSGYYPYRAGEIVPRGYAIVDTTRTVSADRLTTTITFTNEIQKTNLTVNKLNEDGGALEGASFTVRMVKNMYGEAPRGEISADFTAGSHSELLPNGYYVMEETGAPEGTVGMVNPVYFTIFSGAGYTDAEKGLHLTNEDWTQPMDYEGVRVEGLGDVYVLSVKNAWQRTETGISGLKVMRGRELEQKDVFTFVLTPADGPDPAYPGMGGQEELRVTNEADGRFQFDLTYTYGDYLAHADENGTAAFTYRIVEQAPDTADANHFDPATQIAYSRQVYGVEVILGLDEDGGLTVLEKRFRELAE